MSFKDDLSNIEKVYVTSPTPRRGHFWVVIEELASSEAERVQGMVGLEYKSEKEAELRRMSIDSSVRRLGVASQLLAVLLSFAKSEGYKRVFLTSGTHMPAAHRFYEANGFKFSHVIPEESACYYYYELL
jgi:GNAT superfamily N-acetyltransferase